LDAPAPVLATLVLLGAASNVVTALPDTRADRAAKKRTWPVRRGEGPARRDALALLAVGLMSAALFTPRLSLLGRAAVLAPAVLFALGALRHLRRSDSLRFVFFAAGAITLLHLSWSAALFATG